MEAGYDLSRCLVINLRINEDQRKSVKFMMNLCSRLIFMET